MYAVHMEDINIPFLKGIGRIGHYYRNQHGSNGREVVTMKQDPEGRKAMIGKIRV